MYRTRVSNVDAFVYAPFHTGSSTYGSIRTAGETKTIVVEIFDQREQFTNASSVTAAAAAAWLHLLAKVLRAAASLPLSALVETTTP